MSNEEDLYYSCMNFCKHFFYYMCQKEKRMNAHFNERYECPILLDHDEAILKRSFDQLCESIDKVKKEGLKVKGEIFDE